MHTFRAKIGSRTGLTTCAPLKRPEIGNEVSQFSVGETSKARHLTSHSSNELTYSRIIRRKVATCVVTLHSRTNELIASGHLMTRRTRLGKELLPSNCWRADIESWTLRY